MAQKKKKAIKTDNVEKKTAPIKEAPKSLTVSSAAEAKRLVNSGYKSPQHLQYVVLENGQVFYGIHKSAALKYANRFDLKYFDVEF